MGLILSGAPGRLAGVLTLSGSKSSSNRWLIMKALAQSEAPIAGISTSEDTVYLTKALETTGKEISAGAAGTAMRFLTAYLAQKPGSYLLRGLDRAHERPVSILVDALRTLGADIRYLEKEGYPPLGINGKKLKGGDLTVDASVSSQYLTALLLIGPYLSNGLNIHWEGALSSAPYVEQTIVLMREAGIAVGKTNNQLKVAPGTYALAEVFVEPDWSSAGYWIAFACLLPGELLLTGLKDNTPQADRRILNQLSELGLSYQFETTGLRLTGRSGQVLPDAVQWDFSDCPDLAPTQIVLCAALGIKGVFTGLKSLRIKESDRLLALQTELARFGAMLQITADSAVLSKTAGIPAKNPMIVDDWQDHRMAMALSLLVARGHQLVFEKPEVVAKSYPSFWEDLSKFGFQLKSSDGR